jgi:uncharacterized protein
MDGAVDGEHYFDAVADDAVFEFRYVFPGFPTKIVGRDALMAVYSRYGDSTILHSGDALIVHRSQKPGVPILEYQALGAMPAGRSPTAIRFHLGAEPRSVL